MTNKEAYSALMKSASSKFVYLGLKDCLKLAIENVKDYATWTTTVEADYDMACNVLYKLGYRFDEDNEQKDETVLYSITIRILSS